MHLLTAESFDTILKKIQKSPVELVFTLDIWWSVREKMEKKRGTLLLAPQNRFDLTLGTSRWTSDGKTVWNYSAAQKQVVIRRFNEADLALNPSSLFARFNGKSFTVVAGKTGLLQWKGKDSEYQQIFVQLSPDGSKINRLEFTDNESNKSTFTFSKMNFPSSVNTKKFTFVHPAGTEVLDER